MRTTYTVHAERDGEWWVLTVPDVPGAVSQVASLDEAPEEIRDAISLILEVPADSFDVTLDVPPLPSAG